MVDILEKNNGDCINIFNKKYLLQDASIVILQRSDESNHHQITTFGLLHS